MLLKITESLPRKSAVSPVYSSPPRDGRDGGGGSLRVRKRTDATGKRVKGGRE